MLVEDYDLPLPNDDGHGARPVVGELQGGHEAGWHHVIMPSGSTRSLASTSDRMTTTTPAAMSTAAGHAPAGGVSPTAIRAMTVAPRVYKRIATATAMRLIVESTPRSAERRGGKEGVCAGRCRGRR